MPNKIRGRDYDRGYSRTPSVKEIAEKAGVSEKLAKKMKEKIEDIKTASIRNKAFNKRKTKFYNSGGSGSYSSLWNDIQSE